MAPSLTAVPKFAVLSAAALLVAGPSSIFQSLDPVRFEDVAGRAGVHFVLRNSATPERRQIETMVAGVAVLDYNADGWPDIYFVNGASQPSLAKTGPEYWNRLYRNNRDGTFTDVTQEAGVRGEGFATGAAAGDYDNDGFPDLFLAGVNRNILYHNRGDGTFEDVTARAGLAWTGPGHKPWSIAAGWFDYDSDGLLDLLVVNYCVWDPDREPACMAAGARVYCHPKYYPGLPNQLFRNRGDGAFLDVSAASGIGAHVGKGMAVSFLDYDQDGRLDALVTNDTTPNFLFRNLGGGRFEETALVAGLALNEDGRAVSSMGADARDLDNDGLEDVFMAAAQNETFPLFRNLGKGVFADVTYRSGLGRDTLTQTGWSNGVFDFNNDGRKDLFIACGSIDDNAELFSSRSSRQRNLLFLNAGNMTFREAGASAGEDFRQPGLHRGVAFGDFDRDGRIDAVVSRIGEPARLFRNVSPAPNHWVALRLKGRRSNRDGIGALVQVVGASGTAQWNRVTTATGYACSSDRIVHFGLSQDRLLRRIEIRWPSGATQTLENVGADRYLTVDEP